MITFQTGHIDSCRTDGIGLTPSRQCIHAVRATTRRHGRIFFVVFPRYYFFSVLRYRHGSNGSLCHSLFRLQGKNFNIVTLVLIIITFKT